MRAELSPSQLALHLRRRKEIWEAKGATTCRTPGGEQKIGFASDTEAKAGVDKRTIQRATARASALGDDLNDVAGTSLDKGVELDALAKLSTEERRQLIDRAKQGEQVRKGAAFFQLVRTKKLRSFVRGKNLGHLSEV
jgi:hypothetical protein